MTKQRKPLLCDWPLVSQLLKGYMQMKYMCAQIITEQLTKAEKDCTQWFRRGEKKKQYGTHLTGLMMSLMRQEVQQQMEQGLAILCSLDLILELLCSQNSSNCYHSSFYGVERGSRAECGASPCNEETQQMGGYWLMLGLHSTVQIAQYKTRPSVTA